MRYAILPPHTDDWPALMEYGLGQTRPGRKPLTREQKRKRRELKQTKRRIRKLRGKK